MEIAVGARGFIVMMAGVVFLAQDGAFIGGRASRRKPSGVQLNRAQCRSEPIYPQAK